MTVSLNVDEFVKDYCEGVKDRDLLAKYKVSAREMVTMVKRLMQEGALTKEDYFNRNRKIEEYEARQEKAFLQSLQHCPVCGHIHPVPFTVCPACGTDVVALQQAAESGEAGYATKPAEAERGAAPEPEPIVAIPEEEVPEGLLALVGTRVEDLAWSPTLSLYHTGEEYVLTELITLGTNSAMFKAEPSVGEGWPIGVELYDPEVAPDSAIETVLKGLLHYQSTMDDVNLLKVLGSGTIAGWMVLLYEYVPLTFETLLKREPQGISLDLLMELLPQVLNAVGYSHMHRATDATIRRLPHLGLGLSQFYFDEDKRLVKLDGYGFSRSLVDMRGHLNRLWEEPGADLCALPPEAFVLNSKFVNGFLADIYAVGVLLYRLVTGKDPFTGSGVEEYSFLHLKTFPVPPRVHRYQIPGWLDAMIMRCLDKAPEKRWRSATQMELAIGKSANI